MSPPSSTLSGNSSQLGTHFGSVLGIVADQYRTLMEAILEAIQNGLDVNATKINVNINQQARNVHVQDNGDGATRDYFEKCLRLIAKSQKDRGKLGQFGIGVVASFNKCQRFTFTSHPRGRPQDGHRWVFNCLAIKKAAAAPSIPCLKLGRHDQWWHSELCIEGYTKNHLRSAIDFDGLITAIYDRYGAKMLQNKCTIHLVLTPPVGEKLEKKVQPLKFQGNPLKVRSYTSDECGTTTFRIFTVDKDKKNPNPVGKGKKQNRGQGVRVMDSTGFTLPLTDKVFPCNLLKKKDADLFRSGYFEGEVIFSDQVQLDPSRRFFREDLATAGAVEHIEKWLNDVGRGLIERMEDEASTARYRDLGNKSLKVIDRFLKDKRNEKLANLIRGFKWGSQGVGHAPTTDKKDGTSTGTRSNTGGTGKKRRPSGTGRVRDPNRSPKPRKNDTPLVVDTPDGNPRIHAKHDSTGLTLSFEKGGLDLWKLEKEFGIIHINILHPTWVAHDRLDGSSQDVRNDLIMKLQERIILHVLLSLKLADDLGADLEDILTFYAHEFEDHHQFLSTKGDKIAERGRYRGKKKTGSTKTTKKKKKEAS